MGSSRDLMDEEVEDANATRGTPYTNSKGWSWDAASDSWIHDDGTRMSHFTPTGQAAIVSGGRLMGPTTSNVIGPLPYPHGITGAPGSIVPPGSNGDLSFTLDKVKPIPDVLTGGLTLNPLVHSEIAIMTSHGQVKINLDTGVLTIPHGIGREEAIRDFWLGFQENFRGAEKTKYENEIASLKKDIEHITQKAEEYKNEVSGVAKKSILKKITEKYGNEKFIMIKPADLIKMIEGA